ncbi:hypothetical protein [Streptomyces rhizosphaericus]|uniref:hypothetical protein n=1 Tax=Streptomyces rhizosphaericus TaxID=114699 RepID=UPI00117F7794|nr:hypothetical protein [Streptomyces rhizosphaericus]
MKMIDPASIPEFTGDLEQLDKDVSGLRGDAITIRDGGMHAHSRFQMLEGFYTAPEAGQLFASTWPAAVKADAFAGDLEKVADALDTFAYEIRPLVKRLKQLKADAFAFVDSVEGDDDWTEDEGKVDRHQQLWDGVNAAVAAFQEAERKASTTISGLVGGPKFLADDGSHTRNRKQVMYGYDLDSLQQAKELPWGSPVSQTYDALDFGHHFKSFVWDGLVVDNIWGGLKGLKTLTGLDGGDAAGKAWGHLGDVVGGIGQYTIKPYDAFMDWAFGEDQDSPDEARQKQAAKDFGKSLVAWDMWSENPARASATVVFNGLTLGAVPAARVIKGGKAGAAAQGAAKIGEYLDPLSATFKVGGKAASSLPKLSELTANTRALDNVAGSNRLHSHIELSAGSRVRIEDGAFIRLDADGNPVHDTPRQEPRADQRAAQHEAAPKQRELAEIGANSRTPGSHVGRGDSASPTHDAPPSSRDNGSGGIPARRGITGGVDGLDAPRSSHAGLNDGSGPHHPGGSDAHGEGRGDHNGSADRGKALTEQEKIVRRQVDRANNEPGYFEKYYKNNGNRIRLSRVDESGFTPPQLVWDARTKSWIAASDAPPPLPERYIDGADRTGNADSLSGSEALKDLDKAAAKRHSAISADKTAEETLQKAKEALAAQDSLSNRKALAAAQAAHRPLHKAMSDAAEKYGEAIAQHHVIPERYPNAQREVLDGPANGNDQFDQVWRRHDGGYVVIEAKSNVRTELGARNLPSGKRVAQGTREYFDDILREMRERGKKNRNELRLADELEDALDQGKLDYILVKGKVSGGKYAGYHMRKFDIS